MDIVSKKVHQQRFSTCEYCSHCKGDPKSDTCDLMSPDINLSFFTLDPNNKCPIGEWDVAQKSEPWPYNNNDNT